ncbi:uncharacterized protein LOC121554471 [Coregonus clupeaformis]|uniref:uncharacterized protein LOC121554471 n=1 Tax=Coregonus clupeaformis TaxID=59861 RepID=UPI001E1C82C5|nr:uncharacterized protein LOC121554471 [Coregonus clupeaformis]
MRKHCDYSLLVLVLIHTGTADSVISVSHTRDREHLSISCRLRGNDTVSQINWEMISSPNHTTTKLKLGTFHPVFGTYVVPEYNDTVEIQGSAPSRSSRLDLKGGDGEEDSQLCCIFITFPSGVLEQCTHTRINESTAEAQDSEAPERLLGERTLEQWALLVGGSTISILSIVTSLYYCWKYCCRHCCHSSRRRMFDVETYLTDQHTESEGVKEEPPPATPFPHLPSPSPRVLTPPSSMLKSSWTCCMDGCGRPTRGRPRPGAQQHSTGHNMVHSKWQSQGHKRGRNRKNPFYN